MKASLITSKSNIQYLSNFTGSSGFMLIAGKKKYLFTDFRYIQRAKDSIKKGIEVTDPKKWQKIIKKHKVTELGIEEDFMTISRLKKFKKITKKVKFYNISGKTEKIREIKTKEEIFFLTKSQRINEKVFKEIRKIIKKHLKSKKTLREMDLAWKIKELGREFGAEDVSFDPIVAFGSHSSIPHHLSDKTKLKKGDMILIDMGMKYKGYCSDMSRMLFTAKPNKKQSEIYNLVLEAQENAIQKIKAGITGIKADKLSREMIEKAGYGKQYGHAGGHGLGLDIHEIPSLSAKYPKKIRENSIITVEPGIYLEGKFGVRIEDMVLVTKTGTKNLSKTPKSQDLMLVD